MKRQHNFGKGLLIGWRRASRARDPEPQKDKTMALYRHNVKECEELTSLETYIKLYMGMKFGGCPMDEKCSLCGEMGSYGKCHPCKVYWLQYPCGHRYHAGCILARMDTDFDFSCPGCGVTINTGSRGDPVLID